MKIRLMTIRSLYCLLQIKLCQLDDKQQELIRDNMELKELCLYLDEERANLAASIPASCSNCGTSIRSNVSTTLTSNPLRDDGDGSSFSTNDEPMPSAHQFNRPVMVRNLLRGASKLHMD